MTVMCHGKEKRTWHMQKINLENQKGGVKYEIKYTGDMTVQKFPKRESFLFAKSVIWYFFLLLEDFFVSQLSAFFEIHMKTVFHV